MHIEEILDRPFQKEFFVENSIGQLASMTASKPYEQAKPPFSNRNPIISR
jgi:hypothetical protein